MTLEAAAVSVASGSAWTPWALTLGAAAGTFAWRAAGVLIANRIDPSGPLFRWFTAMAYGLLAALIGRVMVLPEGLLASSESIDRFAALGVGFALFFAFKRHLYLGLAAAMAVFACLTALKAYALI